MMSKHPLAERPTYTNAQLDQFLSALPRKPSWTLKTFKEEMNHDPLRALANIQRLSMSFVPWGSLALHYSTHHTLQLDHASLFHKIVERRLGGYCMENNMFFFTILHSLGYECYISGARISNAEANVPDADPEGFGGFQHQVIWVIIDNQKYLVDIGFGTHGSIEPLPVKEGATAKGTPGVTQRLVRKVLAPFTAEQTLWLLEVHTEGEESGSIEGGTAQWRPAYCTSEIEWLPQDFEIINYRTSRDPQSMFTFLFLLTKTVLDDSGENVVVQRTMVNGKATVRDASGKKDDLVICTSEAERVDALAKWFDIHLTPEEIAGIKGRVTELKA